MSVFDNAFAAVVGNEGIFTSNPLDPGNWTGGRTNVGTCKGTKYGVSAAAYPALDIANLTLADAEAIYRRDYWDKIAGDSLPPPVALVVFDAFGKFRVVSSDQWLQTACGVTGGRHHRAITIAAVRKASVVGLVIECNAQRLLFMASLPTWRTFGLGWTARVVRLGIAATGFEGQAA